MLNLFKKKLPVRREDEVSLKDPFDPKFYLLAKTVHSRHNEIMQESLNLLQTTVYPKTFFGRCSDVAFSEEQITGKPSKFLLDLDLQTELQIAFIDRALAAGKESLLRQEMPRYDDRLTAEAAAYYHEVMEE